jgi:hypothetical protein
MNGCAMGKMVKTVEIIQRYSKIFLNTKKKALVLPVSRTFKSFTKTLKLKVELRVCFMILVIN